MNNELLKNKRTTVKNKPTIFNLKNIKDQKVLQRLLETRGNAIKIVDELGSQLKELFLVRNPRSKFNQTLGKAEWNKYFKKISDKGSLWQQGKWVYFEWNNYLVHILDRNDFFELRSARNKNLITKDEQKIFQKVKIGIAGLSVGSSVALALTLESGCQNMNLADFDELELSNLNRIAGGICSLGENKAILTAKQIYELNPYAKLNVYNKGLNQRNLGKFISGAGIVVDEMDDLVMKIKLRELAKKYKIPVVSATDNDSHSIVDIERFDLEPGRSIFHGKLKGQIDKGKIVKMGFGDRIKLINNIVGVDYITERMQDSLFEIGKKLYSWPQLGGAAMIGGGVLTYAIRQIILGNKKLKSGKYEVNPDEIFISGYNNSLSKKKRKKEMVEFLKKQDKIFK